MRAIVPLLSALFGLLALPAQAEIVIIQKERVEVVSSPAAPPAPAELRTAKHAALARYGPFRVLDDHTAALVDVTNGSSPAAFTAMMRAYPDIAVLQFHDCPGTYDDVANLHLGRLIRAAGLEVEVPAGGSVRSGAVDLMLAGRSLTIADDAEFAVHAWLDEDGRGAGQYAPSAPEHRKYLAYYHAMGMAEDVARRFYAMTNSVPYEQARWLTGAEMRDWIGQPAQPELPPVRLAYLDLSALLQ